METMEHTDGDFAPQPIRQPTSRERQLAGLRPPWKKGEVANPNGRPKGARNILSERFLEDLQADWRKNGARVIERAREKDPVAYMKVIASLVPREDRLEVLNRRIDQLSLEEVRQLIAMVEQAERQTFDATAEPIEEAS